MNALKIIKASILVVISLVVLIPAWYTFLDRKNHTCTIEEFLAGKYNYSSRLTITGNIQFRYASRYVEYKKDSIYNVSYFIPFVDSLWTPEKPIRIILEYESGKMAFDEGFGEAVKKLDLAIDSLSDLPTNRLTVSGNNKILKYPRIDSETKNYLEDNFQLKTATGLNAFKIVVNEHFSMTGLLFVTAFAIAMGVLLYFLLKKRK